MLNRKYQVYPTVNTAKAIPDADRLRALAVKLLKKYDEATPDAVEAQTGLLLKEYRDTFTEAGVCAGMVCSWAFNYFSTDEPACPMNIEDAQFLQSVKQTTTFKRRAMEKPQAVSVSASKMYQNVNLVVTRAVRNTFPQQRHAFMTSTAQMLDYLVNKVPFTLSVKVTGAAGQHAAGVKHALGLLCHDGIYYVLEPNLGLYKFASKPVIAGELNNHFIQGVQAGSNWSLKSVSSPTAALH